MNDLLDRYLWCSLQVTLFTFIGSAVYLFLRKQSPYRSSLPTICLAVTTALSILAITPWPSWNLQPLVETAEVTISPKPIEKSPPSIKPIKPQPDIESPPITTPEIPSELPINDVPLFDDAPPTPVDISPAQSNLPINWKQAFLLLATLLGFVVLLRLLVATKELFKRLRNSKSISDPAILKDFADLKTDFQLKRKIDLRQSSRDDMPSTIGWRKPTILLPKSWSTWSQSQRRAVLAHELAHIHNHDFATWIAVQAPLLLHSYHPLLHWLARRVRWEQELAADRLAAALLGDRSVYLKSLAELALGNREPAPKYSLAPTSSMIVERLKMLRQTSPKTSLPISLFKRVILLTFLCLVALAVSGLRGVNPSAIAEEPKQEIPSFSDFELKPTQTPTSKSNTITAYIQINVAPQHSKPITPTEFKILLQSQIKLLKSQTVQKVALAQKEIAKLPTVTSKGEHAIPWLAENLSISSVNNSDLVKIQLKGSEDPDDMMKIINAVIKAYSDEAQHKKEATAAAKNEALKKLRNVTSKDLRDLVERYQAQARELGGIESDESAQLIQILTNRLDRVDDNISRIEEEQLKLNIELEQQEFEPTHKQKVQISFFERRLQQLEEKREELFQQIKIRNKSHPSLTILQTEIEQLQKALHDIEPQLRETEIAAGADHVRILQPATIGPTAKADLGIEQQVEQPISILNAEQLKQLREDTQKELAKTLERYQKLITELGENGAPLTKSLMSLRQSEINSINTQIGKAEAVLVDLEVGKTLAMTEAKSPLAIESAVREALEDDPMMAQFDEEKYLLSQRLRQLQASHKSSDSKKTETIRRQLEKLELEEQHYQKTVEAEMRKKVKPLPDKKLAILLVEYEHRKDQTTKRLNDLRNKYKEKMAEVLRNGEQIEEATTLESEVERLQTLLKQINHKLDTDNSAESESP